MLCLLGNLGNSLNGRRAGADHTDPFAGELYARMREAAGVIPLTFVIFQAFEFRHVSRR